MKKAIIAMILACALLASCLAAFAEGDNAASDIRPEAAALLEKLYALIDMSQYEERPGSGELNADHKLDSAVTEAEIEGTTLKLGMSFEEVIAAGFTAPEGYADEEGSKGLSYNGKFRTGDGKKVELGFSVGVDGEKLSNGVLNGIGLPYYWTEDLANVAIKGISVGADLSEVVEVMGEPEILKDNSSNLKMRYGYSDDTIIESVTFYIDFDGKVAGLGLGGTFKK